MGKAFNYILTALSLLLAIPVFLIIASWNALPGDTIYPVKTGLEKGAMLFLGNSSAGRYLKIKYTKRRFDEANHLLEEELDSKGYDLLLTEVEESRDSLLQANDRINAEILQKNISVYRKRIQSQSGELKQLSNDLETTDQQLMQIENELNQIQ